MQNFNYLKVVYNVLGAATTGYLGAKAAGADDAHAAGASVTAIVVVLFGLFQQHPAGK